MIRTLLVLWLLFLFPGTGLLAQEKSANLSITLESLFGRISKNIPEGEKIKANDSIVRIIDPFSASDSAFSNCFSKVKYLGQVTSTDSLVRIINWNLIIDGGDSYYYCYIIKRDRKEGSGKVTKMTGVYKELPENVDSVYSVTNWYGALYYDIRPFDSQGIRRYILLGIDYGNRFVTRKIIDVLSFNGNGDLSFGHRCFSDGKRIAARIVFEYSSRAVMSLRFAGPGVIVFDHLSPSSPARRDDRQFYGPDFSFDSFSLENGTWIYRGDIDIKIK